MAGKRIIGLVIGIFTLVIGLNIAIGTSASVARPTKKVIYWGWGQRDTMYLKDHWREMEKMPFDGVSLEVAIDRTKPAYGEGSGANRLGQNIFGLRAFQLSDFKPAIEDLKIVRSKKLKENFLSTPINTTVQDGGFTWFDDQRWQTVLNNWKMFVTIAKEGGLKGVLFDFEAYGGTLFSYEKQNQRIAKSLEQYNEQVRRRGREFMEAASAIYPDMTIWMYNGYSIIGERMILETMLNYPEKGDNALEPAFLDGMLEGAAVRVKFVDFNACYGDKTRLELLEAYHDTINKALLLTKVPDLYRARVRAGIGLWLDAWNPATSKVVWDVNDFSKNWYSPAEMSKALALALEITDEYVWIYSQSPKFFPPEKLPPAYFNALAHPVDPDSANRGLKSARTYPGADDRTVFSDLTNRYDEVLTLPHKGWKFMPDTDNHGDVQKVFTTDYDDTQWHDIEIAEWWEPQGYNYDGVAWYRQWIDIPASAAGKKLMLVFGAVDESAWVYVNGKPVGEHNIGSEGWNKRFELDVTNHLKPGQKNLIAVKVNDIGNYGGIWKSVKLMTPNSNEEKINKK